MVFVMRKLLSLLVALMVLTSFALAIRPDDVHPADAKSDDVADAAAAADPTGARWAERTLSHMTLEEKVGQLFMVWAKVDFWNLNGPEYIKLRDQMKKYHLGSWGITAPSESGLLVRPSPLETAAVINQLQRESDLPLLFAADFERGLPMRLRGGTVFPHAMAFGAAANPDYVYQFGRVSAAEARAIGVHWNFFPDADVNSNPNNPIINTRAFGEDSAEVSAMVAAYIRGAHELGGLTTAKHFPGHGDTDTDTHLAVGRVNGSLEHLNRVELPPFRAAIAAGVDSVMVGHLIVPALEPDTTKVATISPRITTTLLKQQMGFNGIVVTDALDMNGLTKIFGGNTPATSGRAAVMALKAGADYLIIPGDLDGAYNGVLEAVRTGELTEARIDQSVLKLLQVKAALRLHKNRLVDLNAINQVLNQPESVALAQHVAEDAITLVSRIDARSSDARRLLPLPRTVPIAQQYVYHPAVAATNRILLLVFTDDARGENGRALVREMHLRAPDARVIFVDDALSHAVAPQVMEAVAAAERVVVAVYVGPSGGKGEGTPTLDRAPSALLSSVLRGAAEKSIFLAMGSPYILAQYPAASDSVCTFSNATVSEAAVVRFLFGEIPARGRMPVTVPGVVNREAVTLPEQ
jgi:beta-N-acetylhexosaminidase